MQHRLLMSGVLIIGSATFLPNLFSSDTGKAFADFDCEVPAPNCQTTDLLQPDPDPGLQDPGVQDLGGGNFYPDNNQGPDGPSAPEPGDDDEGEDPLEKQKCLIEQALEKKRDDLAKEIANQIKTKSDWERVEYGASIFQRQNGEIVVSALFRGDCESVGLPVPASGSSLRLIGTVHNHTRCTSERGNRSYIDGDYFADRDAVNSGVANENELSSYILSSDDGTLYEFDYEDGETTARPGPGSPQAKDAESQCNTST